MVIKDVTYFSSKSSLDSCSGRHSVADTERNIFN